MLLHVTASGVSFNVTVCYHFNCVKLPHHRSTANSAGQYIVELQLLVCYHWYCSGHCVLSVWQLNIARQRDSLDSVWWCHWCAIIVSACYRWKRCSHCKWIISWPLYHSRSITSGWLWLTVLWFALYYIVRVLHPTMDLHRLCYHLTLCHMSAWVQLLQLTAIGVLSLQIGYLFPLSCIDSFGLMMLALLN